MSAESPQNRENSHTATARVNGRIRVELTDDDLEEIQRIADARNQSYADGRTTDTNYTSKDGVELHNMGLRAEYAMSLLYEEFEIDRTISAKGDGGIDGHLVIDGEEGAVDVKSTAYQNAWLLVRTDAVSIGNADIYITAYVPDVGSYVEIVGFAWAEEIIQEENIAPGKGNHENYKMVSGFERMPVPNLDDPRATWRQ